jgi:NAD(P)H-hydrate epimerase
MQCLYTAYQTRELDRLTIEQGQVAGYSLMCAAGKFAFQQLLERWPDCQNLVVLCGKGNNGGDGYVVAELARLAGIQVTLYSVFEPEELTGDAYQAFTDCQVAVSVGSAELPFQQADVVVDALLGTGLSGDVRGLHQSWIEQINAAAKPVLAIDIPSGLCADTGRVLGCAVEADVTATFIGRKQGMYTGQARSYCGDIWFADLGVRQSVYGQIKATASLLDANQVPLELNQRSAASYKTHHGHVFVVGGDTGTFGAVVMAAQGAARAGAGLISVYTQPEQGPYVTLAQPELMLVRDNWQQADVLVVGPGLGQGEFGQSAWQHCLGLNTSMVVDADGLNLLATNPVKRDSWILTPHPGEAGRLLGVSVKEIEADRYAAARQLQQTYGGVVILKGAGSLICGPDQHVYVLGVGNAGMASGGMGDVLAGVCGAMLGQGLDVLEAAKLGAWLHSKAADLAAVDGPRGMLATDLLPFIRRLVG